MTTYVSPYTGQTLYPSQVGYESITLSANITLQWPINGNTTDVVASVIDVYPTGAGFEIAMPPATEVSTGQANLFRNTGASSFEVTDNSGNTIFVCASGQVFYIYLTDNSTVNGTWRSLQIGSATSASNAAELAGYGLTALGITLNTATPVSTFSADYTLLPADRAQLYVWTGGAGNVTLPTAAGSGENWFCVIKNNGTGILNVLCQGSDTIDGQISKQLQIEESVVVVSSGSVFYSYAYGQSAEFFFTQLVKNVTGGTVTLTSTEAQNIIQEYQGTLTSNCTVILPPTVQLYSLRNLTTGAFTLTFETGAVGATTLDLPQDQTILAICDGTNVYNAQTATTSFINALTLGNGSAAAPSLSFLGDALTGLYLAASHQLGFAVNGVNGATLTPTGLLVPVGINAGAF